MLKQNTSLNSVHWAEHVCSLKRENQDGFVAIDENVL